MGKNTVCAQFQKYISGSSIALGKARCSHVAQCIIKRPPLPLLCMATSSPLERRGSFRLDDSTGRRIFTERQRGERWRLKHRPCTGDHRLNICERELPDYQRSNSRRYRACPGSS
jgi:hypothetical protein